MSGTSRYVSAGLRSDKLKLFLSSTAPSGLSVSVIIKGTACRSRWSSTSTVATNRQGHLLLSGLSPVHPSHNSSRVRAATPTAQTSSSSSRRSLNTMAGYSTTVSKPTLGVAPEEAKDHHVRDAKGELVGFQNPHPSAGVLRNTLQIVGKMLL